MIMVEDKLISEDIGEKKFVCDLKACKGACCVEGDAGAPLDKEETEILDKIWSKVKPYLSKKGRKAIQEQGKWIQEGKDSYETPLIDGKECAYTIFEGGYALCGIEKAYLDGAVDFKKPISCHLYPIRTHRNPTTGLEHMNYDRWDICEAACSLGEKLKVPVYQFLKEPLSRKYGEEFYTQLSEIFESLEKED